MSNVNNINAVRKTALDRIDRSERHYKVTFFAAALIEASFFAGFILLPDFSNRMHVLLLITTVAIYSILALGLVALGVHINRNTLRVLNAVELLGMTDGSEGEKRI
jgi:hypothetical protein